MPRTHRRLSLALLALALGGLAPAQAQLPPDVRAALASAEDAPPPEVTPGDELQARYMDLLEEKVQAIRDLEPTPVGNSLPLPAMGPTDNVELKRLEPDQIVNMRLLGHANEPLKLLMVLTGNRRQDTRDEVRAVLDVVKEINEAAGMPPHRERLKLHLILGNEDDLHRIDMSEEEYREHVEIQRYFSSKDIWMQDWGEIGAVLEEGAGKERTVVFDSNRGRGLAELPGTLAKNWNAGYIKGPKGSGAGNYGGNIEVTPDDILVLGDTSTQGLRDQFAAMGYADRTVVLETQWLLVGHVDEYLSTLPTPDTELGYTILKADPALAMSLLKKTGPPSFLQSLERMVTSAFRFAPNHPEMLDLDGGGFAQAFMSVGAIHAGLHEIPMDLGGMTSDELLEMNRQASEIIERNTAKLVAEIKARRGNIEVPVVSVPTLFARDRGKFAALTPGVANMVVLRKHLVIPDPLVPEFQANLRETLPALGFEPRLVPNLTYHIGVGQLHCGTNTFRHPNRYVHDRYRRAAEARLGQLRRAARFRQVEKRID